MMSISCIVIESSISSPLVFSCHYCSLSQAVSLGIALVGITDSLYNICQRH
jgi:hypothetical protein